ncbi:unnamed protein product [Brachionus calyciflorus]|uniref:Uncharacterized protein n=1 Tax=Brachionus calyciflorus TaxID=104777 RepID=A0A814A343_9BILA|nr:unnamed protein product [Brachionus calyciflorus]
MIAVVTKGVELTNGFQLREIQLLSLLIMLETNGKGRIAQINTGEGKITTIAMLAVIKALCGKTVDIITSSPELAKHQSKQLDSFYNILYGTAGHFQGDILRDEYSKLGTRNGRKFEIAILDEVDSMLIDDRNHIVMLSSTTPGMNNLEGIYAAIWLQVNNAARCIKQIDGKYYYIEITKDPFKDDGYTHSETNEQTAALDENIKEIAYPIETSIEELIRRAISLTVSIVCAGFSAIKDVAKILCAGVQSACKIMNFTIKVGWKLAFKVIGKTIAKKIAQNMVNKLVDYGLNKTLVPVLEEKIFNLIKKPIQDALEKNVDFCYLYKIDCANRNLAYCNLVIRKALELLNPKNDEQGAFSQIAKVIIKGIAQAKLSGLSETMKIAAALQGLTELSKFVPVFLDKLDKEISTLKSDAEKEVNKSKHTKIIISNKENNRSRISESSDNHDFVVNSKHTNDDYNNSDIDLNKLNIQDEQLEFKNNSESIKDLSDKISDKLSVKMCSILQNKIISLTTNALVDFGMKTITQNIDNSINESIQNYQAERRIEFFQDEDRNNRIGSEFKNGIESDKAVEKVDEMISSVKNGAPLGLYHLGCLSESVDRPIRVYDENNNLVRVVGENRGGQPLDIQYIDSNNEIGHWIPKGESKSWELSTTRGGTVGKYDCLPDAIAELTGQDSNTVRNNLVNVMNKNKANLANQVNDIQRLEVYNHKALTIGGLRLNQNGEIKLELRTEKKGHDDIAMLNKALSEKKRGGEKIGRLFTNQVELAVVEGLPLKDENNKNNYKYHHLIPNQEIEALLLNKTTEINKLRNSSTQEDKSIFFIHHFIKKVKEIKFMLQTS